MGISIDTAEFRHNVKKMVSKRVSTQEDQEDITQEVLLKILAYARTEDPGSFFAWLKMAVHSSIGDFYRKTGKKHDPLDSNLEDLAVNEELEKDLTCCIDPFLNRMDAEEANLIREVDLHGKAQIDVSKELGIRYSTLKSRLQKSRKSLLEKISVCCPPDADSCATKCSG